MRIIAGKHRGRRIESPDSYAIRPTSSRTREAVFNILTHGEYVEPGNSPLIDQHILDICCGTGAFGLEALSRGAAKVTFIDKQRDALKLARHNAEKFGESERSTFLPYDATNLPKSIKAYALAYVDPPYKEGLVPKMLVSMAKVGWVNQDSLIITEQDSKYPFDIPEQFEIIREKDYSKTKVLFLKLAP
jgi:16S rRNA (guanine966-N2)-methyltransferase